MSWLATDEVGGTRQTGFGLWCCVRPSPRFSEVLRLKLEGFLRTLSGPMAFGAGLFFICCMPQVLQDIWLSPLVLWHSERDHPKHLYFPLCPPPSLCQYNTYFQRSARDDDGRCCTSQLKTSFTIPYCACRKTGTKTSIPRAQN